MFDQPGLHQRLARMQESCAAASAQGRVSADHHTALLDEMRALAAGIEGARQDVAALRLTAATGRKMPAAADELDAVVLHTAAATGAILDACETLEALAQQHPLQHAIGQTTARIYAACCFQDITGQRVAKVVQTLQMVEAEIAKIVLLFGEGPAMPVTRVAPALCGPLVRSVEMDQRGIDALMARGE